MLAKLAEIVLSAKSSAVSGVLILAGGAVVSASAGAGTTGFTAQDAEPAAIVNVAQPASQPLGDDLVVVELAAEEPEADLPLVSEAECEDERSARAEARERIEAAFKKYDAGLESLRADLGGKGSAATYEAIDSADALLEEIRTQALGALDEMGLCQADLAARVEGAVAFAFSGGAAALLEVSDRAIAAMELVYDLARSTVLTELERLRPTPTPKPKATPKSSEKAKGREDDRKREESRKREKSERARCDETVHAAKKRLGRAFEEFHGGHDKLIRELKKWADERTLQVLHKNDEILHRTYDGTKERILRTGCASGEESGMALAERAAALLQQTYGESRGIALAASAHKPNRERCKEQMHAAKKVLYTNFEHFHGANDRLWKAKDGFSKSTSGAIKSADRIIHETYDRTKQGVHRAACGPNGSSAMELAANAAGVFEKAHQTARVAVGNELARSEDDD
ncbi:MAG: hypothetical protein ACRDGT_10975 [Candidatus Limnocylindria bacterium]